MNKIIVSIGLLYSTIAFAQQEEYKGRVGINNNTPSATLNVKSKTGTDKTTKNLELENANGTKMVSVLDNGNVGINTTDPSQKLDIQGNARVREMLDGTNTTTYKNYVVADANGVLAVTPRTESIKGTKEATEIMETGETFGNMSNDKKTGYFRYAGQKITLPPGKWIIYAGYLNRHKDVTKGGYGQLLTAGQSVWIRAILSSNKNNEKTTPINFGLGVETPVYVSSSMSRYSYFSMTSGFFLVNNNSGIDQTYYLKVDFTLIGFNATDPQTLFAMGDAGEDYLIAVRRD